jgi:hypothetical protein
MGYRLILSALGDLRMFEPVQQMEIICLNEKRTFAVLILPKVSNLFLPAVLLDVAHRFFYISGIKNILAANRLQHR